MIATRIFKSFLLKFSSYHNKKGSLDRYRYFLKIIMGCPEGLEIQHGYRIIVKRSMQFAMPCHVMPCQATLRHTTIKINHVHFIKQLTVHRFLPFGLMAGLVVVAAIVVMTLPETYNRPTMENLSQDLKDQKQEKDENKNTRAGEDEENALL